MIYKIPKIQKISIKSTISRNIGILVLHWTGADNHGRRLEVHRFNYREGTRSPSSWWSC